jgi:hypothetical protein
MQMEIRAYGCLHCVSVLLLITRSKSRPVYTYVDGARELQGAPIPASPVTFSKPETCAGVATEIKKEIKQEEDIVKHGGLEGK